MSITNNPDKVPRRRRLRSEDQSPHRSPSTSNLGRVWADEILLGGQTQLQALKQEVSNLVQPDDPMLIQLHIDMVEPGEPGPFGGAGDTPEFIRQPWKGTVWIGPAARALEAITAMIDDPLVGRALWSGASIEIGRADVWSIDEHREICAVINRRLEFSQSKISDPFADQVICAATRVAFGQGTLPQAEQTPGEFDNASMLAKQDSPLRLEGVPKNDPVRRVVARELWSDVLPLKKIADKLFAAGFPCEDRADPIKKVLKSIGSELKTISRQRHRFRLDTMDNSFRQKLDKSHEK